MAISRRQFLYGAGGAGLFGAAGLTGCAPGSSKSGGSGPGQLAVTWWGNPTRNANTSKSIAAFLAKNSGTKITEQTGEFATYWDKLATQVAGGTAPDLIQMDMAYIAEYGGRGALLDLSKHGVDTSKFSPGTVDSGKVDGALVGANAGINTPTVAINPAIFAKAKMDLPDDTTWTWDDLMTISVEVGKKAHVAGLTMFFGQDAMLAAFLRQNGKELWTADGLGFEATDAQQFFDLMVRFRKAGAIPSPAEIAEEWNKTFDQSAFATGKAAITGAINSNQLSAINDASGTEMKLLRWPSLTGKATDRKAWYKAAMLWSASAKTKNPEVAASLINWFINSTESNDIELAERGIPANSTILADITPKLSKAQQEVAKFLADIKPELGTTPVAPPPGGGTLGNVMFRYQTEVLFGRQSTKEAATKFVAEVKSNLKG